METSSGFAQIFLLLPKKSELPKIWVASHTDILLARHAIFIWGAATPLAPPTRTPMPIHSLIKCKCLSIRAWATCADPWGLRPFDFHPPLKIKNNYYIYYMADTTYSKHDPGLSGAKNASRCEFLENSRILRFFVYRGPLGKSHFWEILSKYILLF